MAKDVYGYLRQNKEQIAEVLSVGFDVANYTNPDGSQPFVDFTRAEAKELYVRLIDVLQEPGWTTKEMRDVIYDVCDAYRDVPRGDEEVRRRVERIARTELNRILFYAKEQSAVQDGQADYLFQWAGPLDKRTTPMCRYMQTGELTGENNKGEPYDYEYLRPLLPEWNADGKVLPELKDMCREVHDVFFNAGVIKTPMITDWQMHINCRHTFMRNKVAPTIDRPTNVDGWIQVDNKPPEGEAPVERPKDGEPMNVTVVGETVLDADDVDELDVQISPFARLTFGFENSSKGIPSFILPESEDNDEEAVFQFSTVDEYTLGAWLRFYSEEVDAGMDIPTIIDILTSESNMTFSEIAYIQRNWTWMYLVALEQHWI